MYNQHRPSLKHNFIMISCFPAIPKRIRSSKCRDQDTIPYFFLPAATTLPGSVLPVEPPPRHRPQAALPIMSSACVLSVLPSGLPGTSLEKHITQEHLFPNVGSSVPGPKSRFMKIFLFPQWSSFLNPFLLIPFFLLLPLKSSFDVPHI